MSTVPTPAPAPTDDALADLRAVVHRLRAPGGCPWDQEQTHETLIPHLIEEAYEVAEAIRNGDMAHLREELGDLLLQPVLHAEIASETGTFDLDSIARELTEKLIRRHPHVFGDTTVDGSAGVLKQWDEIKKQEKGGSASDRKPHLHGVSRGLPALMRAQKIQKKAAKVGFDWPDLEQVVAKVHEEVQEIMEAVDQQDQKAITDEVGDLLYSVVNVARRLGVDAETALAAATAKFERRFGRVEETILAQGKTLEDSTLEEMDAVWEATKHLPASSGS